MSSSAFICEVCFTPSTMVDELVRLCKNVLMHDVLLTAKVSGGA